MSKIYTKTGDSGNTTLVGGTKISKSNILLEAYGSLDELNAQIALFLATANEPFLCSIQQQLFAIGGMLATPPELWTQFWQKISIEDYIADIEREIDKLSAQLAPLQNFIIPGGSTAIAQLHICRTVCRRCERIIAKILDADIRYILPLQFANRLADYLFILARFYHKTTLVDETLCKSMR